MLTQQKNWKQLERAYRKMLHRIAGKGNADLEHTLWHQLGLIYRDRLQQTDSAIEAFKMAATSKPDTVVVRQILAELYEVGERWDEAIAEQRVILEAEPLKIGRLPCALPLVPAEASVRRGLVPWRQRWPS